MDEHEELVRRRLERERRARKAAEAIIEEKSRELYAKSLALAAAAEAEAQARRETETLRDALEAFTSGMRTEDVLAQLRDFLERLVAHDGCAIYLEGDGDLHLAAACGSMAALAGEQAALPGHIAAALRAAGVPSSLSAADAAIAAWRPGAADVLMVPVVARGRTTGCLVLEHSGAGAFDARAARLAQALAGEAGLALENARLFAEVERLSQVDALTGLHNRRHFAREADVEWQRCQRHGRRMAALMLDIDHFKEFNDSHGHAAGDHVLVEVAAMCRGTIRIADLDVRYGGEEFCFLLPETGLDEATVLAERLRAAVASLHLQSDGATLSVTVSIGVAEREPGDADVGELIRRADAALYQAKNGGRDRVATLRADRL